MYEFQLVFYEQLFEPYFYFDKELTLSIQRKINGLSIKMCIVPTVGMSINIAAFHEDYGFTEKELEALDDCNEEVRLSAAEGIKTAAGACCACSNGCSPTCCTEKIQAKLTDMSSGETDGCFNEPSARVRRAATSALAACPPLGKDPIILEPDTLEPDSNTDPTPADSSAADSSAATATLFQFGNYTWLPEARKLDKPAKSAVKTTKRQVAEKPLPSIRPEQPKKKTSVLVVKHRPISPSKK